jgi:hypothetical protein
MGSRAGDSRVSGAPAYGLGRSLVRSGGQMVRGGDVGWGEAGQGHSSRRCQSRVATTPMRRDSQ